MAKSPDDRYPSATELIADLEAVANSEAPLQARKKYDQRLLESLANGGQVIEPSAEQKEVVGSTSKVSIQWALALGVLLALSLLSNVLLIALLAGGSPGP